MVKQIFLVVPRIEVHGFNATAGAYIAGVPQPTTICGLVHAFSLALQRKYPAVIQHCMTPVLYAVSEMSSLGGQTKAISYQKSNGAPRTAAAAMTSRPRGSITFSLVMALTVTADFTVGTAFMGDCVTTLEALRLSGAAVWVEGQPFFEADEESALKRLPKSAFILSDESDTLQAWLAAAPGLRVADAIGALCSRPRIAGEYKPRFVPISVGVRRLTDAAPLTNARYGYAHAYAEPVVGVGRFRSVSSVLQSMRLVPDSEETHVFPDGTEALTPVLPRIFWNYSEEQLGHPDLLLVKAFV